MKSRNLVLLGLTVFTLAAFNGCGNESLDNIKDKAANTNSSDVSSEDASGNDALDNEANAEEAKAKAEEAETEKYNAYINVNNFMFDRLTTVIDSYFNRVVYQKEFKMDGTDYWCNSLGDSYYELIDTAKDYAAKEPSFGDLDKAYEDMYPVLKKLMKTFDEVYNYGELKEYMDDDYAGAKELHKEVWRLYKKYNKVSEPFLDEISVLADKRREESLQYYKDEGMMARYTFIKTIDAGQAIQQYFYDNEIDDSNLTEANVDELKPLYDDFTALIKESYEYANDSEQLEKEGMSMTASMFSSALTDTKASISKLYKRIKEGRALESYEINTTFPSEDTIAGFEAILGDLIDDYNRL